MIRNLTFDIFCISYMFGYFHYIPNIILLLIIIFCTLDAIALYFSTQDVKVFQNNPFIKKWITIYLKYSKPSSRKENPIWFFFDRFVVGTLFILFVIYYIYKHGLCNR